MSRIIIAWVVVLWLPELVRAQPRTDTTVWAQELAYSRRFADAEALLRQYSQKGEDDYVLLAYIQYWRGHPGQALATLQQLSPEYPAAAELRQEIHRVRSPWIIQEYTISADDQPLRRQEYRLLGTWYSTPWLSPTLEVINSRFTLADTVRLGTGRYSVRNKFSIPTIRQDLEFGIGLLDQSGGTVEPTWALNVQQRLMAGLSLHAGVEQQVYQYTIASLSRPSPLMYRQYAVGVTGRYGETWQGDAFYQGQQFDGGGRLDTYYGWLLARILPGIRLGYAYNYAHSDSLTWQWLRAGSGEALRLADGTIAGVYDPYFSPQQQQVHSILLNLDWRIGKKIQLEGRLMYGFGQANAPYYTEISEGGAPPRYQLDVSPLRYHPAEADAGVRYSPAAHLTMGMRYRYRRLFFYEVQSASLFFHYQLRGV